MKRAAKLRCVVLFALLINSLATLTVAQNPDIVREDRPDIIRSFRLIPSHSTLHQSGGFAGLNLEYRLRGEFDVVTGFELSPAAVFPPIYVPFAHFDDVDVKAQLNHPAAFAAPVPLSKFVDLEELRGTFKPSEPRVLTFRGYDQQDQPFKLLAVQRGRLLHLMGASDPTCCDFFQYKLDALAHIAPFADFNLDGMVDRADSDRVISNMGLAAGATFDDGDADGDGDVDGDDFLTWQSQLGTSVSLSEFAADTLEGTAFVTASVPEPATLALCFACVVLPVVYRRRHSD